MSEEQQKGKITKKRYNEILEEELQKEITFWGKEVKVLSKLVRSKDPEEMIDGQAMALGYREQIESKNQEYLSMLVAEEEIYKKLKAKRLAIHITGRTIDGNKIGPNDIKNPLIAHQKINHAQREMVISGELADYESTMQILRNGISYNNGVLKILESYDYLVKHRLELFNMFK